MDRKLSRRRNLWLIAAMLMLGCALPSLVTPTPVQSIVQSSEILGTSIVQTSEAAQTQTAAVLPSITPTFTVTRIPTETQTPTPTFIFSLFTATLLPSETAPVSVSAGGGGTPDPGVSNEGYTLTGKEWTCTVTSKYPGKGAVIQKGLTFNASWTILNTGTKTWTYNGVDFRYIAGLRMDGRKIQDLPVTVAPGNKITLKIQLTAPNRVDTYSTTWTLRVGRRIFCPMRITFDTQ
jgi:hypothetical protein